MEIMKKSNEKSFFLTAHVKSWLYNKLMGETCIVETELANGLKELVDCTVLQIMPISSEIMIIEVVRK